MESELSQEKPHLFTPLRCTNGIQCVSIVTESFLGKINCSSHVSKFCSNNVLALGKGSFKHIGGESDLCRVRIYPEDFKGHCYSGMAGV